MKPNSLAFRYNTGGSWYKGNTHIHSIASDGGMSVPDLAALYSEADYDFLFLTDHWVSSDLSGIPQSPTLLIDGIELDGKDGTGAYFHVVCLGRTEGIRKEDGFENAMRMAREQGALMILAHPHWCGNTLEDANRWGYDGVEIYNHECSWLNGKSSGLVHWEAMLQQRPDVLCFSSDDAHLKTGHPGWNGGWIAVNAPDLSRESILGAIKTGNFYASCGPEFRSIDFDGQYLDVGCSPVRVVRLIGPAYCGWRDCAVDGGLLEHSRIEIPGDWPYAYVEIEDREGKKAWTNTLFVQEPVSASSY